MKVTKLHIDKYKVFKDFDIDFTHNGEAQNLIVLAGINGTGKTTLLEFIIRSVESRYTSYGGEKLGKSFIDFFQKEEEQIFIQIPIPNFTYIGKDLVHLALFDKMLESSRNPLLNNDDGHIHFFKIKTFEYNGHSIEEDENNYIDYSKTEVGIVKTYIDKYIYDGQLRSHEVYKQLSEFINSILSNFLLGFKFSRYGSNGRLYFDTPEGIEIELDDLSTGERQLINFVLRLFVADIKDSIILIDEPEFSLHPSWQNRIVSVLQKYANEYNCQVILATHSPHIIGSVKPEQLRLLYKDESGAIKVKDNVSGSYGWPIDKVLVGLMDVNTLRTPEAAKDLEDLNDMVRNNKYESDEFKVRMKKLEDAIGADDDFLTRLRFEIIKRRKESEANK